MFHICYIILRMFHRGIVCMHVHVIHKSLRIFKGYCMQVNIHVGGSLMVVS